MRLKSATAPGLFPGDSAGCVGSAPLGTARLRRRRQLPRRGGCCCGCCIWKPRAPPARGEPIAHSSRARRRGSPVGPAMRGLRACSRDPHVPDRPGAARGEEGAVRLHAVKPGRRAWEAVAVELDYDQSRVRGSDSQEGKPCAGKGKPRPLRATRPPTVGGWSWSLA